MGALHPKPQPGKLKKLGACRVTTSLRISRFEADLDSRAPASLARAERGGGRTPRLTQRQSPASGHRDRASPGRAPSSPSGERVWARPWLPRHRASSAGAVARRCTTATERAQGMDKGRRPSNQIDNQPSHGRTSTRERATPRQPALCVTNVRTRNCVLGRAWRKTRPPGARRSRSSAS